MDDNQNVLLARVESAAIDGRMKTLRIRQRLLQSLHKHLLQHRVAFLEATQIDDGCSKEEAQIIFAAALIELRNHYDALNLTTDLDLEYSLAKEKDNEARRVPFDIAYIIPDTSAVLFSILSALCAAIEAGSCVVVELENTIQKTPTLLRRCISESLDNDAFCVVACRATVDFLSKCVVVDPAQKLATTEINSTQRILSSTISQNVAMVDRTADVQHAAEEVVASRLAFGGRSRYAVDIVLVNEFQAEEMTKAVIQAMERRQATGEGTETTLIQSFKSYSTTSDSAAVDEEVKSQKAKLIHGDSVTRIVKILDRASSLVHRKFSTQIVVLSQFSSLDDAIDLFSKDGVQKPLVGALYLFAAPREAKYLSQYISSQASFVNHIPAQLLVGPIVPQEYSISLSARYSRAMFEYPSPQITKASRSHLASKILNNPTQAAMLLSIAQKPLKPTGQKPPGATGFFEQGMILGALVYLLPLISVSLFGIGYVGLSGYRRVFGS